jgi:U6 snRNA-associated Sm-like protein LSm8
MSDFIESLLLKTVNVITNDGRNFIGDLQSFDQKMNIILSECKERIYSTTAPVESVEMKAYLIRGDNVAVIGEVDQDLEENIDYSQIKAPPLKPLIS